MASSEIKFYTKRELSLAQQQRITDHRPSVGVGADGSLVTYTENIITPRGDVKEVTYKSIRPNSTERMMKSGDVLELFTDLQHINLIVTNACNLSCSYCYEQHNKDYGRFTLDSLKTVYDFLVSCNSNTGKLFQFFGGEPLIHKQLILDFISTYRSILQTNGNSTAVSIITNGILLTPEFISEYFSNDFVCMSVSLDTDDASIDHREIGQSNIDRIIDMIGLIPAYHKDNHMVSVRCTIAMENAHRLYEFAKRLYENGLRAMVIHPLTMSSVNGHMVWSETDWTLLHQSVLRIIDSFPNFEVQFSEGVGAKGGNNCMVGSDMIAIDASGDYSGCHFFTNQKEVAGHTILGNLLHDQVYVDRYVQFQDIYNQMFISEPQCQACDLKGFCYQCPAGNSDSGRGQLFRPDGMCQNIVRLFLDLQNDIVKKTFFTKLQELTQFVSERGEEFAFAKSLTHLMYYKITGTHVTPQQLDSIDTFPPYETIAHQFWSLVEAGSTTPPIIGAAPSDLRTMGIKELYERLMSHASRTTAASSSVQSVDDLNKRIFYLALIHMITLNKRVTT